MQITDITRKTGADRRQRRIGRGTGSGKGKTAGRGENGARSRSGWRRRGMSEGGQMPTFRRVPKRGFSNARFRTEYSIVNVADLEDRYNDADHVTRQSLVEAGLVRNTKLPIKVLGEGTVGKRLLV